MLKVGEKYGLKITGTPVFRARRIEAGLLSAGCDFDRTTTPFEVGLARFVDMNKNDFVGKKSLNKSCRKSRLWGMRVRSGISQKGRSILQAGKEVGIVTSSTWSPYQECGVAIVRMDFSINVKSGLELEAIGLDGNLYYAQICELPMYDPKGEIVRGINRKTPTEPSPWLG